MYPYKNREQRLLDSIYVNYKLGENILALAQCDLFDLEYPQSRHRDYVLYMRGLINFDSSASGGLRAAFHTDAALSSMGFYKKSYQAFYTLSREFPAKDMYLLDANYRMHYLRNLFARHQLLIARYYFKRGAYLAAANRANYILLHLNGTSSILESIQIMRQSYALLGLHDLSQNALRILYDNHYPMNAGIKPYLDII